MTRTFAASPNVLVVYGSAVSLVSNQISTREPVCSKISH